MPNLITDSNGIPSPQYLKRDGTSYEALKGSNGGMDTNIIEMCALPAGTNNIGDVDVASLPALPAGTNNIGDVDVASLPALPAGTNVIGKVKAEPVANVTKYLASCTASADNALWTPETGKAIILKGIRIQNLTAAVGSVVAGLGSPDAIVDLKAGATVIAKVKAQGKHFLSDTTDKIYLAAGNFEAETILFGEGLIFAADTVLNIYPDQTDVTVFAWGYEV